jgi:hypothetical protein
VDTVIKNALLRKSLDNVSVLFIGFDGFANALKCLISDENVQKENIDASIRQSCPSDGMPLKMICNSTLPIRKSNIFMKAVKKEN